jgi:hypothetical protein
MAHASASASVNHTQFAGAIAENALEIRKLIGGTERKIKLQKMTPITGVKMSKTNSK